MLKIQGFGLPFDVQHSSCSTLVPKTFLWSKQHEPIQIYLDGSILNGARMAYHDNKYAWICESRYIGNAKLIRQKLLTNKEQILSKYKYLFTCEKELCQLDSRIKWCYSSSNLPWCFAKKYESYIPEKTKLVSMLCSPKAATEGHKRRLQIALKEKHNLVLYGGAHGSKRPGEGTGAHRDKSEAINSYMFSLVIENDSYPGYFTEKITDCFARGTIPIYYGDPDICEHFDCDGIIPYSDGIISKLSKELYESKMQAIQNNMQKTLNMQMSEDYFVTKYILNK